MLERGSLSLAQAFTPGKVKQKRLVLDSFRRLSEVRRTKAAVQRKSLLKESGLKSEYFHSPGVNAWAREKS